MTGSSDALAGDRGKDALREELLERRKALGEAARNRAADAVWHRVRGLDAWREAGRVGFYVSVGSEVGTRSALEDVLDRGEPRVAAPATVPGGHGERGGLVFREVPRLGDLEAGPLGVPEPRGAAVDPGSLDVVLVPGVGFDARGNRLGRGGGYYDGFLAGFHGVSVGLAFEVQVVDAVPVERHDEPVDLVVTEERVLEAPKR